MEFEFDPVKSATNLAKHGIDFVDAQALWADPNRMELPARSTLEPRTLVVGRLGDQVWTAVTTWRGEQLRLISVRHARDVEKRAYFHSANDHGRGV